MANSVARQREAAMASAQAELERLKDFVRAEDRAVMEAKVHLAGAKLEMAKQTLSEAQLLAPCDGTVLEVLKREGDAVSAATVEPTILFGDLSRLRVRAELDESFAQLLQVGQRAQVRPSGERGSWCNGTVILVKPIMGNKTVFSRAANERKDVGVIQVLVDLEEGYAPPVGLEMDVRILLGHKAR